MLFSLVHYSYLFSAGVGPASGFSQVAYFRPSLRAFSLAYLASRNSVLGLLSRDVDLTDFRSCGPDFPSSFFF